MTLSPRTALLLRQLPALLLLFLVLGPLFGGPRAGELEERRIAVALKLFPALLAADQELADKRAADGSLPLLVVYGEDPRGAEQLVRQLAQLEPVREYPLRPNALPAKSLPQVEAPVAGVFIAEPLGPALEGVITFGRERRTVVFSPFEGDVERGVLGGISVTERILPFVNRQAMQASGVRLKPFFLRIADLYE